MQELIQHRLPPPNLVFLRFCRQNFQSLESYKSLPVLLRAKRCSLLITPSQSLTLIMAENMDAPKFNIQISSAPLYLLSTPCNFQINLLCELESKEPISVSTRDSIFDPSALSNGLFRVVDSETGEALDFGSTIQTKEPPTNDAILAWRPGERKLFSWTTDAEDSYPSHFFIDIKTSNIKPDCRYLLQYQHHGITKWFRNSKVPADPLVSIGEDPRNIIVSIKQHDYAAFNTSMELPKGPPLEASLSTSCPQLDLSGDQPCTAFASLKLLGNRRICILLNLDC
jgi:hypothetical protein